MNPKPGVAHPQEIIFPRKSERARESLRRASSAARTWPYCPRIAPDTADKIHVQLKSVPFLYRKVSVMLQSVIAYNRDKSLKFRTGFAKKTNPDLPYK